MDNQNMKHDILSIVSGPQEGYGEFILTVDKRDICRGELHRIELHHFYTEVDISRACALGSAIVLYPVQAPFQFIGDDLFNVDVKVYTIYQYYKRIQSATYNLEGAVVKWICPALVIKHGKCGEIEIKP